MVGAPPIIVVLDHANDTDLYYRTTEKEEDEKKERKEKNKERKDREKKQRKEEEEDGEGGWERVKGGIIPLVSFTFTTRLFYIFIQCTAVKAPYV